MTACTGEPISWPRLEQFALDPGDPAIAAHLAGCAVCRDCLERIRGDAVALPPLAVPDPPGLRARGRTWRRWWLAPVLAAAAAVALVVLRPPPRAGDRIAIKGIGEVVLELVRERAGAISYDARRYAPGDRWKIVLSCPPAADSAPSPAQMLAIDVSVADGITVDRPLAATRIACGNRVVVPGAFTVTGDRNNRVCVRVAAIAGRAASDPEAGTACATLLPETR
ncbi:MAG TPA: hypothetical protein VHT91_14275 [Kofleriaceae bacterium]|nr:hypothetical protein [Kofleriaceae bacterium]